VCCAKLIIQTSFVLLACSGSCPGGPLSYEMFPYIEKGRRWNLLASSILTPTSTPKSLTTAASPLHLEHKTGTIKYSLLALLQAVGSHYCLFAYVERPMLLEQERAASHQAGSHSSAYCSAIKQTSSRGPGGSGSTAPLRTTAPPAPWTANRHDLRPLW
jgi:hypothetical protein